MRVIPRSSLAVGCVVALVAGAAGCGDDDPRASGSELTVVATTTQVADFVGNVGGDRVEVHGILGTNADPHDYEPRPSDVAAIADAPVVFKSGGDIDGWLDELIENAGGDHRVITLIDSVHTIQDEHGETDPHWWE